MTAKKDRLKAIDLIGPKDRIVLKTNGLNSSICNGAETGKNQALRYLPNPGRYDGAYPYKKGDKAWLLKKLFNNCLK